MIFGSRSKEDDTVVEVLATAIRRDISFGTLTPDQKLKIDALRQSYGGSNHSIRETLRVLVAEGMVEATNQRGFRVTSATDSDMRDILLMRIEIETLAVKRALELGDVTWEAQVIAALHELSRAEADVQEDPSNATAMEWDEACRKLAAALVSACGSPRLTEIASKFYNQARRFRLALLREGRIDFAARKLRQDKLRTALVERDEATVLDVLQEDIHADLGA